MKPFLFFLAALILIAGGYFGGKLFEKPQVINSFSFPSQNPPADLELQIKSLRIQNELRDAEILELVRRVQETMNRELSYHHQVK